ncbi:MAG TPA: PIG-L deacetylase family protein [Candidatus Deferrimicrobiaceae bacterium]
MARRLMLLLAHPDDETFGPGGTIARYAREGVEITLVTATRGEEGMVGDPPVTGRERLGEVREAELAKAATVLGIREVVFLGFRDKQLEHLPFERILEKAVEQVRRVRPQVLIGFGPEGVSRHPDHVVMSRVALEAFDAAADPARFPGQTGNGLSAYAPYKLYQFEIAREILDRWEIPLAGVPGRELTTFIDTSGFVETKVEAFSAHRTQARDARRILSREGYREFSRQETYVLARSRACDLSFPEKGLFQGIPEEGEAGG